MKQIESLRTLTDLLKHNGPFVQRLWLGLVMVAYSLVYLYFALGFSFEYYGIASLSGISYSWPNMLVSSFFVPFAFTDLPRIPLLRLLAGFHSVGLVAAGISFALSWGRRKMAEFLRTFVEMSDRLQHKDVVNRIAELSQSPLEGAK